MKTSTIPHPAKRRARLLQAELDGPGQAFNLAGQLDRQAMADRAAAEAAAAAQAERARRAAMESAQIPLFA